MKSKVQDNVCQWRWLGRETRGAGVAVTVSVLAFTGHTVRNCSPVSPGWPAHGRSTVSINTAEMRRHARRSVGKIGGEWSKDSRCTHTWLVGADTFTRRFTSNWARLRAGTHSALTYRNIPQTRKLDCLIILDKNETWIFSAGNLGCCSNKVKCTSHLYGEQEEYSICRVMQKIILD